MSTIIDPIPSYMVATMHSSNGKEVDRHPMSCSLVRSTMCSKPCLATTQTRAFSPQCVQSHACRVAWSMAGVQYASKMLGTWALEPSQCSLIVPQLTLHSVGTLCQRAHIKAMLTTLCYWQTALPVTNTALMQQQHSRRSVMPLP